MSPAEEKSDLPVPITDRLAVEVSSALPLAIMQRRSEHVNVLLRLSMMTGLQMQLEATLKMLCDFTAEIVSFDCALVYFWNEAEEQSQLRVSDRFTEAARKKLAEGNILDYWCRRYGRPLLINRADHPEADSILDSASASSALIVPVLVNNRVMGSIQVFSAQRNKFNAEDAQLLWMLSRIAENLLT